ncbi:hypothetical protein [Actinopolymorpha alba]|uniref:hypothetical protein n=1 Tax=Actinopolymorpha alba TaxID=533267 RepID=UPI0003657FB6|nr:hypothetical protein [Actinopolymorpha alba]
MNDHQHDQDLTDDLRAGLARLATYARTHHDPASDALRRARRMRSRRRATAVVAGVAAIAVVLPIGLNLVGPRGDHTRVDPATATPTPAPTRTATPSTSAGPTVGASPAPTPGHVVEQYARKAITISFDGLPRGEQPKVPWYADGKIHNGTTTTPAEVTPLYTAFEAVAGGYLISRYEDDQPHLRLIGLDGTEKLSTPSRSIPVVSRDRQQIAWATEEGTINVTEARTGKVLHSVDLGQAVPVGFLDEQVVLTPGGYGAVSESDKAQVWDPRTGQLTLWKDFYGTDATDGSGLAGVLPKVAQERKDEDLYCAATIDTDDGNRELWRVCPTTLGSIINISGFSPSGRYAQVTISNEGQTVPHETITDARTGRPVLTIQYTDATIAWEDDEHFLLSAYDSDRQKAAIIRCTPTGTCELATEPRSGRPYELPSGL